VPWYVVAAAVVELFVKRGTRELLLVGFVVFTVGLNELVWKLLLHQPRPLGSCVLKCGMPSGHSTMAIGFGTLMFLDLAFRVCPTDPQMLQKLQRKQRDSWWRKFKSYLALLRISNASVMSNSQFASVFAAWFVCLAPVPASRVFIQDHTMVQAAAGSAIGCLEAVIWFCLMRCLAYRHHESLGSRWPAGRSWFLLRHDYTIPSHELLVNLITESSGAGLTSSQQQPPRKGACAVPAPSPDDTDLEAPGYPWNDQASLDDCDDDFIVNPEFTLSTASSGGNWKSSDVDMLGGYDLHVTGQGRQYISCGSRSAWLPSGGSWRLLLHEGTGNVLLSDGVRVAWPSELLCTRQHQLQQGTARQKRPQQHAKKPDGVSSADVVLAMQDGSCEASTEAEEGTPLSGGRGNKSSSTSTSAPSSPNSVAARGPSGRGGCFVAWRSLLSSFVGGSAQQTPQQQTRRR